MGKHLLKLTRQGLVKVGPYLMETIVYNTFLFDIYRKTQPNARIYPAIPRLERCLPSTPEAPPSHKIRQPRGHMLVTYEKSPPPPPSRLEGEGEGLGARWGPSPPAGTSRWVEPRLLRLSLLTVEGDALTYAAKGR